MKSVQDALLATRVSHWFDHEIRERGLQYFRQGRVRLAASPPGELTAHVQGESRYVVTLRTVEKRLRACCSCPFFAQWGFCKHIWAAILKADEQGISPAPPGNRRINMEEEGEEENLSEDETDDQEEEDDFEEEEPRYSGRAPQKSGGGGQLGRLLPMRPWGPNVPLLSVAEEKALRWKRLLGEIRRAADQNQEEVAPSRAAAASDGEIFFVADASRSVHHGKLTISARRYRRKKDGQWGRPQNCYFHGWSRPRIDDPLLGEIVAMLEGGVSGNGYGYHPGPEYQVPFPLLNHLLPLLCRSGRFRIRLRQEEFPAGELEGTGPLQFDDGPPWEPVLEVARDDKGKQYEVQGVLVRGEERMALSQPKLLLGGGWIFTDGRVARLDDRGAFLWVGAMRQEGRLTVPLSAGPDLVQELLAFPRLPRLVLPEELRFQEVSIVPRPFLRIRKPDDAGYRPTLRAQLRFDYEGEVVPAFPRDRARYDPKGRRLILRDRQKEAEAEEKLRETGFREDPYRGMEDPHWEISPRRLSQAVRALVAENWRVEAEGKLYRTSGAFRLEVTSGIDWFELHGTADFGDGVTASLPSLLAALKRGENTVVLGDGSLGMLPEEWLKKYGLLAGLGAAKGDTLRFSRGQVGFLDALLAAEPASTCDQLFQQAREAWRGFDKVTPATEPPGFKGTLRGYQREGLGWLDFLRQFGFGGCLADDMGLGKTVQVLALLAGRQRERESLPSQEATRFPPSLVVAPRSVVFNWKREAERFAPGLRVLDHTGLGRVREAKHLSGHDLVLTTYGTLRRDIVLLQEVGFDYVILDESQAIKNAATASAKASRLLRGRHRLALSGTPIENHLGELWSLLEFLNPGLAGSAAVFSALAGQAGKPDEESRRLLRRALRPLILRRTKGQVAKDLPAKLEQTLYCELENGQRERYDELKEHYRRSLLARVGREGMNKSRMHVLEALLRLRQAACHPGLLDRAFLQESGAKLEMLLPRLAEVTEEGHKALVFSQFTSLLAIVRDRLDREGTVYEYLDGKTRDRERAVSRFQEDPDCRLFLISLKAGGLGLNLTAAEYVFLLDPWWNPAVEAQAIDRTHRIGQTRKVFAYRIIARNTVEDKILELQQSKRELADAIIGGDHGLIRDLTREDLELLLQ